MKVLYDYQAFVPHLYSGVSNCFCKLISHLPDEIQPVISVLQSNNYHLIESNLVTDLKPALIDSRIVGEMFYFPGKMRLYTMLSSMGIIKSAEYINKQYSIKLQKDKDYDIFHPTFFDTYFLENIGNKPFVLTIHDMMPELFPQYYSKNNMQILSKKKLVNKASAIIAVSERTKQDIIRFLGVDPDKITVIHHAGPIQEDIKQPSLIESDYFLYVGVRSAYKNFYKTIEDFKNVVKLYPKIKLVCTGPTFTNQEISFFKYLDIESNIIHYSANNNDLKVLYSNALAFIYPSLYEGFGIPILEAFAYGCPVILNNASCFPEIAADAAIYFKSDGKSSNLSQTLIEFIRKTKFERDDLIARGYERLKDFSWVKSSLKLANVYDKVLNSI